MAETKTSSNILSTPVPSHAEVSKKSSLCFFANSMASFLDTIGARSDLFAQSAIGASLLLLHLLASLSHFPRPSKPSLSETSNTRKAAFIS
eukprot:107729_1